MMNAGSRLLRKTVVLLAATLAWLACANVISAAENFKPNLFRVEPPQIVVYPNVFLTPERLQNTKLFRLAREVQKASRDILIQFVQICLEEMAMIYEEEALAAREKSLQDGKNRHKLIRWSRNSLVFANQLADLRKSVTTQAEVDLFFESFGELYILINDKPVLVSSPVINKQKSLEQRIIKNVCQRLRCDDKLLKDVEEEPLRKLWVHAQWEIGENNSHVFKTRNGLEFLFPDLKNKQQRQRICLNIAHDLNLIADALLFAKEKGIFIDWGFLYLDIIPGSEKYQLVINQFKDAIHLSLLAIPYLNDYPQVTIPWLQARLEFQQAPFQFHDAVRIVNQLAD